MHTWHRRSIDSRDLANISWVISPAATAILASKVSGEPT